MILNLIESVKQRLQVIAETLRLELPPKDDGEPAFERVPPTIFKGYLPPKTANPDPLNPEFPHIILRPDSGGMSESNDSVRIKFIIGGYSEDPTGYEWILNVIERICIDFEQNPIFDERYAFNADMQWKLFDDQPYPYWIIEAIGSWTVPKVQSLQGQGEI